MEWQLWVRGPKPPKLRDKKSTFFQSSSKARTKIRAFLPMKHKDKLFDVIVIGAGGAGLMCAATAGQRGLNVLVIEHNSEPGKKILISGGGRCNFTNLNIKPECFISSNTHFCKSALARFDQNDFLHLIEQHKIAWHEKTLGQLFCDGSAKQIVQMLLGECSKGAVSISYSENISSVSKTDTGFRIATDIANYETGSLVIATGGLSIPKLGATGFAYNLARQFKLKIVEPVPALVPFTLNKQEALFTELSGVAARTSVFNKRASFEEATLFTHKGLSGPAILQISSYWQSKEAIWVNFFPHLDKDWLIQQKAEKPRQTLRKCLASEIPERLSEALVSELKPSDPKLADFKNTELERIGEHLQSWKFLPNGTEGFAKAEVTRGGVSTAELSSKTMESNKVPGLFFIGEAVDVTGWLGGYNFQWAWSSGYAAGQSL